MKIIIINKKLPCSTTDALPAANADTDSSIKNKSPKGHFLCFYLLIIDAN
jgi:hypothetical protein